MLCNMNVDAYSYSSLNVDFKVLSYLLQKVDILKIYSFFAEALKTERSWLKNCFLNHLGIMDAS